MPAFEFRTNLPLGQPGNAAQADVDPLSIPLNTLTAGSVALNALTDVGASTYVADMKAGTLDFGLTAPPWFGGATPGPPNGMPGGELLGGAPVLNMEAQEFLSWWYAGGGGALVNDTIIPGLSADHNFFRLFPILLRTGENGGWFKEALTHKKMIDGKYADGTPMAFRAFAEWGQVTNAAFPLISTPPPTPGSGFLDQVLNGTFNGGQSNEPYGDAWNTGGDPVLSVLPNFPSVAGSIISAGLKHYYMQSWCKPFRCRWLMVRNGLWATLTTLEKTAIETCAQACAAQNIAASNVGQDALIKDMQALGAIVHEWMPTDILDHVRDAAHDVFEANADADDPTTTPFLGTGAYRAILDSQKAFIKANQVWWRTRGPHDRRRRFETIYHDATLTPDRLR